MCLLTRNVKFSNIQSITSKYYSIIEVEILPQNIQMLFNHCPQIKEIVKKGSTYFTWLVESWWSGDPLGYCDWGGDVTIARGMG